MSGHLEVDGVRVYAAMDRGNLWCMVRTPDKATFDAQALAVGLKIAEESGTLIPAPGVTITEIGELLLSDGTVDTRYHANFWLNARLVAKGLWTQWALAWTLNGQTVTPNNQEQGVEFQGIELIDPATVTSPSNVML